MGDASLFGAGQDKFSPEMEELHRTTQTADLGGPVAAQKSTSSSSNKIRKPGTSQGDDVEHGDRVDISDPIAEDKPLEDLIARNQRNEARRILNYRLVFDPTAIKEGKISEAMRRKGAAFFTRVPLQAHINLSIGRMKLIMKQKCD